MKTISILPDVDQREVPLCLKVIENAGALLYMSPSALPGLYSFGEGSFSAPLKTIIQRQF